MKSQPLLRIGDREIGPEAPCYVIAEGGLNHNGSLATALKLVDAAADAGADAVKFQMRDLPSLYPQELLEDPNLGEWGFQYVVSALKECALTDEEFRKVQRHCEARQIEFLCSPWDERSVSQLEEMGVRAYKVGSPDLVNLPLLEVIAACRKPMILSTGMATLVEIEATVGFLRRAGASFGLLHCVSAYPAPFEALNIRFLETLKRFEVPIGYSGHERGIAVATSTIALGASIIEKHITLDRTMPGPDHAASLEPYGFKKMVRDIRIVEAALGHDERQLCRIELLNRQVLRKSLVAARDIAKGEVLVAGDVGVKGPGKGLTPQRAKDLVGVTMRRDLTKGDCFTERDLHGEDSEIIHRERLKRPWGLKARFHDLQETLAFRPSLVELHFTEEDVRAHLPASTPVFPQRILVHAPEFFSKKLLDLGADDRSHRRDSLRLLQETVDKAAELARHFTGQPSVVVHLGGMSMDDAPRDRRQVLDRIVEGLLRLDVHGVSVLPENLPPRPWYLGGQWYQSVLTRPEDFLYIHEHTGLGMTFDISHAQLECNHSGLRLIDLIRECRPIIKHLHVADASGIDGEGVQVGDGTVDWPNVLGELAGAEFTWVPEIWSGHLNRMAGFIEALNRLGDLGGL